jgi:chromosome segregation ATPase
MRLVSLTVSGYRQYLDQITLQIPPGLIGICGPNGVGKSKLIEAIGYALYGPASAILPRTDRVTDLPAKAGRLRSAANTMSSAVQLVEKRQFSSMVPLT